MTGHLQIVSTLPLADQTPHPVNEHHHPLRRHIFQPSVHLCCTPSLCALSLSKSWRYINHLLTYLLTYLPTYLTSRLPRGSWPRPYLSTWVVHLFRHNWSPIQSTNSSWSRPQQVRQAAHRRSIVQRNVITYPQFIYFNY